MEISDRDILRQLFKAAVDAADPKITLPSNLPSPPRGRTIVIGCGKGVAQMASALEQSWEGDLNGVVVSIAPGADVVVGIGVGATVSVTVT